MGATNFSGPSIIYGDMTYAGAMSPGFTSQPDYDPDACPSITYQADAFPDVRYSAVPKDNIQLGSVISILNGPYVKNVDMFPAASGTANIAALANAVSGTAMTLVSASGSGVFVGVPMYPFQSNSLQTVLGLDMGFTNANCTSGSTSIPLVTTNAQYLNYFFPGQWLAILNVGNAGGTTTLFTQLKSISTTAGVTTIVVTNPPLATNVSTPICSCNIPGPRMGNPLPTAVFPYVARGAGSFINPAETCMRGVRITGVVGGTGGNFLVKGYDVYGQPQSEIIAGPVGALTTYGNKTYKYIASITPQFSDAHTYSVGTSDLIGFIMRSDKYEDAEIFWNGAFQSANTGWLAGDLTNPATTSTKDPRGTVQLGVNGPGTGYTTSPTGSIRLALYTNISIYNQLGATPFSPIGLYGVTPV
jgi:hypothetical protein